MATAKFILRGSKSDAPHSIVLCLRYSNTRLYYSTGFRIAPDYWNNEKQSVRNRVEVTDRDTINAALLELKEIAFVVYNNLLKQGKRIDNTSLREGLNNYKESQTKQAAPYVQTFIEQFIKDAPSIVVRKGNGKTEPVKETTIKQYRITLSKVKEFDKYRRFRARFSELDLNFHTAFVSFLRDKQLLSNTTIASRIKDLKTIAKYAERAGVEVHRDIFTREFFKPTDKSVHTYLNEAEIQQLMNYDFSNNERLSNVRDLLVIACWTGQRISDFKRITSANLKEGYIEIEAQVKTGEPVLIPIHPHVEQILERRGGQFPHPISDQRFNDYVKEVCKVVGLTEQIKGTKRIVVESIKVKKGRTRKVTDLFPKYELISSHTGRRSFATNLYGKLPNIVIMGVTGHKSEKTFLQYIKVTPKENAETLRQYWLKQREQFGQPVNMKVI